MCVGGYIFAIFQVGGGGRGTAKNEHKYIYIDLILTFKNHLSNLSNNLDILKLEMKYLLLRSMLGCYTYFFMCCKTDYCNKCFVYFVRLEENNNFG